MTRDMTISNNGIFRQLDSACLVADDVQAYRIVYRTGQDLEGCTFQVTAIRADGQRVVDIGEVAGDTACYTLKNNMHSVPGELRLRLTVQSPDGSVLTSKEVNVAVVEGNGEPDVSADDRVPVLTELIIQATSAAEACNAAAGRAEAAAEAVNGHMTDPAAHAALFANKVDKEAGKGLSTNDYSDSEKAKLAGVNAGLYEKLERKNQPGGYAGLNADGTLAIEQLGGEVIKALGSYDTIEDIPFGLSAGIYQVRWRFFERNSILFVTYSMSETGVGEYYQTLFFNDNTCYKRSSNVGGWVTYYTNPVDSLASTETTAPLSAYQGKILNETKVDKVSGKGLSSNDYSDADKAKLASVRSQVTFGAASGDIAVAAGVTTVATVPLSGANITFTTPAAGEENTYHLLFSLASDSASLSFPTGVLWQNGRTPDFAAGVVYELIVTYDGTHYLGGVITYAAS